MNGELYRPNETQERIPMSSEYQTTVCQRCGMGFTLTPHYRDKLDRWGATVIVPMRCPRCFFTVGPLPKESGTVKWFNPGRRYGFILAEDGHEVFFHRDQLLGNNGRQPVEGQEARFHVGYAPRGPQALNVELVGT
jgi:CspA family cold shock protein